MLERQVFAYLICINFTAQLLNSQELDEQITKECKND